MICGGKGAQKMPKDKHRVSTFIVSIRGHPQDLISLQFAEKVCKCELKYCLLLPVRPSSSQMHKNDDRRGF